MILEYFKIAIGGIKKRKLRSWLTLIGIFIGIAAVVSLISIGQGLQNVVEAEFEALGSNRILVTPGGSFFGAGGSSGKPLTIDDVEAIRRVSGVSRVGYTGFRAGRIEWGDESRISFVTSIPEGEAGDFIREMLVEDMILLGSELRETEKRRVIIGYAYGFSNRYNTLLTPGRKIYVNGEEFIVAGILRSYGNEADDTSILMNEHDFNDVFQIEEDDFNFIMVEVLPGRVPAEILPAVEDALRRHRDLKEGQEDFQAETFEDVLASFLVLLGVVQTIIVGIASISLFVGAVGITNTMYTAVVERTKEIGIMKAIGAKNSDIQNMFLIESGLLGLAGGVIGVLFGFGIGKLVEYVAASAIGPDLLVPSFPAWLIIGSLIFAFIIGSVSGVLPAKQAAKMNPVDALATE